VKVVDSNLTGKSLKGALITIYKMIKGVLRTDIIFSWFAGTHAFVAILLSKLFTSLREDAIKNAKVSGENIDCLSTGYDSNYWKRKDEKEDIVLTVGSVDKLVVKRKGFEVFVKAARHIPNAKFVLVGKHIDNSVEYLKSIAPPNVEFTGFVSDEDLLKWYQKVKVYCQLSRYEGLPNALCEAMLCECVPVGTNYCGIPTAIGDTGFYVPYGDPKATAGAIREALNSDKGREARERINEMFSMQRRERELTRIIKEV
jgi:glycosyltransferase involved in cell wall biosynthesis